MRSARLTSAAALFLGGAALLLFGSHNGAAAVGLPRPAGPAGPVGPFGPNGDEAAGAGPVTGDDHLAVTYDAGDSRPHTYTVDCGQSERAADAARCDRLRQIGGPLPAVRGDQLCSMIYGGPQTASVTGVWNGRPRTETYRRTNGCEVARWSGMVPALPAPTAAQAPGGQTQTPAAQTQIPDAHTQAPATADVADTPGITTLPAVPAPHIPIKKDLRPLRG
jgi:hypothetical protein